MKKKKQTWDFQRKHFVFPSILLVIFLSIAVTLWLTKNNLFYLFNFSYIGLSVAVGTFLGAALPKREKQKGRLVTQFLVGVYMFVFLGIYGKENMQIEGFFTYLFMGIFIGSTIHYLVAKIGGTVIFGRGWCGYACWTMTLLDLLPWKKPKEGRVRYLGAFRYVHFFGSLALVLYFMYVLHDAPQLESAREMYWFLIGNLVYYGAGFVLAFVLKDNRAVCKYVCPIPVVQKIGSRFSIMKINIKRDKCIECFACERECPMDIKLLSYMYEGKRVLSTECISCTACIHACPTDAIAYTVGFDGGLKEYLRYQGEPVATKKSRKPKALGA
ncbi:4Fe-4S binding protein [Aneurinibacillus tyrosinisolvens]|uniref:4Fe-4S binding protein n=1 Tax=Aneurinibacillus tyrosinisolvens TaxID=1443435 RepID=UPI00063FB201|nr:4Fe-4S dicluster domain-containing protein [Aneurinibacillus tyrosinisolvens]